MSESKAKQQRRDRRKLIEQIFETASDRNAEHEQQTRARLMTMSNAQFGQFCEQLLLTTNMRMMRQA